MLLEKEKKEYSDKGYFIKKNFIESKKLKELNNIIDKSQAKTFVPYSNSVPWGYGNLIENVEIINKISLKKKIKYLSGFLSHGKAICNLLMVANKPQFIGPDVEWHQEFLNINTYAPGYNPLEDLDKFLQVFIALDDHRIENGPLYVFEGSHKEGILPYENIINSHLNHKRRITFEALHDLSNNYSCEPVLLKKGDAIIFNHLLVHGSPPNLSKFRRRAMILQLKIEKNERDLNLFQNESNYRNNFILNEIKKRRERIESQNIYSVYK